MELPSFSCAIDLTNALVMFWGRQRLKDDDLGTIGRIPCARNSLMSGIATGTGVGMIRALSAGKSTLFFQHII